MADQTLAALTAAAALDGSELFYALQGGADRKVTGAQIATLAAASGGSGGLSHPGHVAGRWYPPMRGVSVANGTALAQDAIRFIPWLLGEAITISELGARMNTNAAGQNVQFAIYASNPATKRPTGAALGATANVSTAGSAGPLSAALTANVTLTPGLYFLAINSSSSTPVFTVIATADSTIAGLLGSTSLSALMGGSSAALMLYSLTAKTFGTWPDVTAETFSETSTTDKFAFIYFKVASVP